jgi:hypothetical protein
VRHIFSVRQCWGLVISQNQFAFSPVTSRNGEKITVALLKEADEAILSPAYQVFEVKDKNELIPEYLFIWFNRSEFDRYTRFNSWGSAFLLQNCIYYLHFFHQSFQYTPQAILVLRF